MATGVHEADPLTELLLYVLVPGLGFAAVVFLYHLSLEAWGRYLLRPSATYNEGWWWLAVEPRGGAEDRGADYVLRVEDEDGGTAQHRFWQLGAYIQERFPRDLDVSRMRAGSKQPWGRHLVEWRVRQPGRRRFRRARIRFSWGPFQTSVTMGRTGEE